MKSGKSKSQGGIASGTFLGSRSSPSMKSVKSKSKGGIEVGQVQVKIKSKSKSGTRKAGDKSRSGIFIRACSEGGPDW